MTVAVYHEGVSVDTGIGVGVGGTGVLVGEIICVAVGGTVFVGVPVIDGVNVIVGVLVGDVGVAVPVEVFV